MRIDLLRRRLESLYKRYDSRFVDPDPLQLVRRYSRSPDQEVAGLIASSLAYGTVAQIKRSLTSVLDLLGPSPAEAVRRIEPRAIADRLGSFRHRFNDGRDVACLLFLVRQVLETSGSIQSFFLSGYSPGDPHVGSALASFSKRVLALDHGGAYPSRVLPEKAGVRFFFPTPEDGSPCKRLNLFLRWMVRRDSVDLGAWGEVDKAKLIIPLDAHIFSVARRVQLTRYKSPSWAMALDITENLRRMDPEDPVKYDFAFHRMGLWKKEEEIRGLMPRGRRR